MTARITLIAHIEDAISLLDHARDVACRSSLGVEDYQAIHQFVGASRSCPIIIAMHDLAALARRS
jgi:hypothetical protein